MTSYSWIVLTKCTPGEEAAFERWYDEVHIPDLLRIPGVMSAKRGRIADVQTIMGDEGLRLAVTPIDAFPFLAIYKLEGADPSALLAEIIRRAGTPEMPLSEHLGETQTILYEDL